MRLFWSAILITFFSIFSCSDVSAQEPADRTFQNEPLRIAIFPFELHSVEDISELSDLLLDELISELSKAKDIDILEKSIVEKSLQERTVQTFVEEDAIETW